MSENEKLDLILSEIQGMKNDIQGMKAEMQEMKDDIQGMKAEMQEMKNKTQAVERKVTTIYLLLENEIRVNIMRVAEGHLDLSRNLHDAMKPGNEIEMLAIKVHKQESDMKEVKAKIC